MKQLLRHAQLGLPRKEWRESRRQDFCWDHEHQAVRHDDEPALGQNVSLSVSIIGADELIAQAEGAAKIRGPRFFRDKRIRARLDDASVNLFGAKDST